LTPDAEPDPPGLLVQRAMCATCIYRPGSTLDLAKLEADVADGHGGFKGARICHHSESAVCAGFWRRHKDGFPAGQIAQRLGFVVKVHHDTLADEPGKKPRKKRKGG
jgi:hypothetical protein